MIAGYACWVLRQGAGEPLVLLHGIISGERVWRRVVPQLAAHHEVIAPTALGHNGGRPAAVRPARIEHVVEDAERLLDDLGLDIPHLVGNSMGGWVALELARRGRARTVCALSPAGAWQAGTGGKRRGGVLRAAVRDSRRSRAVLPLLARSPRFRHWALRHTAAHGERVSPREFLDSADDAIGCAVYKELLDSDECLAPLDPPPCPITLAWCAQDRIFPVDVYGARARELVPGARFIVLDDVGHVPMFDDPKLVVATILAVTLARA
jgi:pimeloyl-ACP methyl ester carboxylesterase